MANSEILAIVAAGVAKGDIVSFKVMKSGLVRVDLVHAGFTGRITVGNTSAILLGYRSNDKEIGYSKWFGGKNDETTFTGEPVTSNYEGAASKFRKLVNEMHTDSE